jgi:hypothetical protein
MDYKIQGDTSSKILISIKRAKHQHAWPSLSSLNYLGCGAPTGQTPAHEPQSMQLSASTTYVLSPAEMQLTGHSASHAPQLMQSSLMKYAMVYTSNNQYFNMTLIKKYRIP